MKDFLKKCHFLLVVLGLIVTAIGIFYNILTEQWVSLIKVLLYCALGAALSFVGSVIEWKWKRIFKKQE
jgi:hypothetical protein